MFKPGSEICMLFCFCWYRLSLNMKILKELKSPRNMNHAAAQASRLSALFTTSRDQHTVRATALLRVFIIIACLQYFLQYQYMKLCPMISVSANTTLLGSQRRSMGFQHNKNIYDVLLCIIICMDTFCAIHDQSINQSIALTPRSLRKRPRGGGGARQTDLHLSLSMHSFLAHSNPFPLTPLALTHVLLHPIFQAAFPSYSYPQPYPGTPSLQILHFPSFQYGKTISGCFSSPTLLRHTPPHFHALSCHISRTHSCYSAHPIYSLHTLLSSNSSLEHALSTAAPHSTSSSLTHMLELVRGYYSSDPSSRP